MLEGGEDDEEDQEKKDEVNKGEINLFICHYLIGWLVRRPSHVRTGCQGVGGESEQHSWEQTIAHSEVQEVCHRKAFHRVYMTDSEFDLIGLN